MDIIGKEKFLGQQGGSLVNLAKQIGDLDTLTKALILTLQVTNKEKYQEVKKGYLDCVREAIKKSFENKNEEERKRIKMLEELDLEIQQVKVDTINQIMGDENGK